MHFALHPEEDRPADRTTIRGGYAGMRLLSEFQVVLPGYESKLAPTEEVVMLTLTEGATEAIHGLVGDRPGAGLRIFPRAVENGEMELALSVSDNPEPTDEVVQQSGCQVFLDQQVAPLVDGRTLDAVRSEEEQYRFALAD